MEHCSHQEWLCVTKGEGVTLNDTDRIGRVVQALPRPTEQFPQLVHFVGSKAKDVTLKRLFSTSSTGRGCLWQNNRLHLDTHSANSHNPIFFADSDPFSQTQEVRERNLCHENTRHLISWSPSDNKISDILHARLFFLFCDVICLFVDDFPAGLRDVVSLVETWAEIGSASSLPEEVRPMVMIVATGPEATCPEAEILPGGPRVNASFSSIEVVCSEAGRPTATRASYKRLREEILCRAALIQTARHQHRCLFSASHIKEFFRAAVGHTANSIKDKFDFISFARKGLDSFHNRADGIYAFLQLAKKYKTPHDVLSSFIGSSILLDAYPPEMHRFDPDVIFTSVYQRYCTEALMRSTEDLNYSQKQCGMIQRRLRELFLDYNYNERPLAQIHLQNIKTLVPFMRPIQTNIICLLCTFRKPERTLSCGYSICDLCVRTFGQAALGYEDRFIIEECPLCEGLVSNCIDLKPRTAGVRVLSIAGGGARGVLPLEALLELQTLIEPCPLSHMFDFAGGSSSGGISVIGLFVLQWAPSYCSKVFEELAQRCFRASHESTWRQILDRAEAVIRWVLYDAIYDETVLETCLYETLGRDLCLFGHIPNATSRTRVAVSAMKDGDKAVIITNYNGDTNLQRQGYSLIRPDNTADEPRLWEAGRTTSAAPIYFKPLETATGVYTDGGLWVPNPVDVALQEIEILWPNNCDPDIVLVLGTGAPPTEGDGARRNTRGRSFTHLWRSFMKYLDDEQRPRKMKHFYQLNPVVLGRLSLDNARNLVSLRRCLYKQPRYRAELTEIATKLLISSFFFELNGPL
ncbi:hypothetical protein MauCBS54593_005322 [Microsporum audouinii]